MRIENLIQFIVPLTFLAIWALTSLFNREAQSLPPRPGRPLGPNGPRPQPPAQGPRALQGRPADAFAREVEARRPGLGSPVRPPPLGAEGSRQDEILIIENEPRRLDGQPAPRPGAPAPRRPVKGRTPAKPVKRAAEPPTPRRLSGAMGAINTA